MGLPAIREHTDTARGVAQVTRQDVETGSVASMRHLTTLCVVVALVACKKEEDKGSAPPAKPPQPEAKATPDTAAAPAADCVVKVEITADKVTWNGGGITGEAARAGGTPDLVALAPLSGKCGAHLTAAGDTSYQHVIEVMDSLAKHGVTAIGLGEDPAPPPPMPTGGKPGVKLEVTPDGTIVGRYDTPPDLSKVVVIAMTTKEVSVNGKPVAEMADGDFSALLGAALPPQPADPTIVVQADKGLKYDAIRMAVETAGKAGYTNVLFAVKNK